MRKHIRHPRRKPQYFPPDSQSRSGRRPYLGFVSFFCMSVKISANRQNLRLPGGRRPETEEKIST